MNSSAEQSSIQDRVNSICNDLYAKGTKPSVRLVLSMLPDISSTSTVHKYFANWKKELEANQQSLYDKLGFSSDFTQSFMKEITRFGVEAEQRYKELSQDANEQRDIALEDLERSEDKLHKQSAVVEQLEKEVSELQAELAKVRAESKSELEKMEQLAQSNLDKEKETSEAVIKELRQQLDIFTQQVTDLNVANEGLRTDIAKAELRLEGNQQFVDEVKSQNQNLTEENKLLNKELASLNKTLASQESTIDGNQKLISNLEKTVGDQQNSLSVAEQERSKWNSVNQDLSQELSSVNKSLVSTTEQLDRANNTVSDLKKTIDEQSSVISKLTA